MREGQPQHQHAQPVGRRTSGGSSSITFKSLIKRSIAAERLPPVSRGFFLALPAAGSGAGRVDREGATVAVAVVAAAAVCGGGVLKWATMVSALLRCRVVRGGGTLDAVVYVVVRSATVGRVSVSRRRKSSKDSPKRPCASRTNGVTGWG